MRFLLDLLILLSSFACLEGGRSFVIQPHKWDYKGHDIGFDVARRVLSSGSKEIESLFDAGDKEKEPILLLNGFGVGSFHQHRLMSRLLESKEDGRVLYAVDYLGQGRSWPKDCEDGKSENEKGLSYCADT
jgi:pimeloyl-ACP methyl ester carboxylesterase